MPKKGKSKGKKPADSVLVIHSPRAALSPISAAKIMYDGPVTIPRSKLQEDITVVNMFLQANFSSSAAGTNQLVATNDPSFCYEWGSFDTLWEEFRVLGFDFEFFPSNQYSKTTTLCVPGCGVIDHESTGALASLQAGFEHGSCRMLSLENPWTDRGDYGGSRAPSLKWRMASSEEAVFTPTSTTLSNGAIKFYFGGLSASIVYGLYLLRFLVQFRGRA